MPNESIEPLQSPFCGRCVRRSISCSIDSRRALTSISTRPTTSGVCETQEVIGPDNARVDPERGPGDPAIHRL